MTQHTPAPWTSYPMPTKTMAEAKANRQLAIAAPDLLNALKMCVIERSEWLEEARAAIAKATV